MLQFFEWYYPADGSLWNHFKSEAGWLKSIGIDSVWLPPAQKGMHGADSTGYDSYDLYDLGEFDQKGSVRTKYGTKSELMDAIAAGKEAGLRVYMDIVLNHMGGADEKEKVLVKKVVPETGMSLSVNRMRLRPIHGLRFPVETVCILSSFGIINAFLA